MTRDISERVCSFFNEEIFDEKDNHNIYCVRVWRNPFHGRKWKSGREKRANRLLGRKSMIENRRFAIRYPDFRGAKVLGESAVAAVKWGKRDRSKSGNKWYG